MARRENNQDSPVMETNENRAPLHTREGTAQEYARKVRHRAETESEQSLYPVDDFGDFANFLSQPYTPRPPRLRSPFSAVDPTCCFVSLYNISSANMTRISFETIGQFEELGQTAMPNNDSFSLLLLRGYPCAKWLNHLGARFGIDPEFFRRHLLFASRPGRNLSKPAATQRRPSCHSDMLSLQVTTISLQDQDMQMKHQKELDTLRKESFKQISTYTSNLALLNSSDMTAGDSFAREFSVHDLVCFSLEQSISIYIPSALEGRLGIVWHDGLRQLGDEMKWPWQSSSSRTNSILKYLPKSLHKPGISSNSRTRTMRGQPQSAEPSARAEFFLKNYLYGHIDPPRAVHDPLYALSPFFNLAVSSEMAILDVLDTKIREELNHSHIIGNNSPTLSNLLYHQQVLGRHIRNLKETIDAIESRYERSIPGNAPDSDVRVSTTQNVELILGDYRAALTYAETLAAECVQGMTITAHSATIRESEKAVVEAQSVTRLTKLAVFFVPLSFVASLFGMNVREVNPGSTPPFWSWAVASLAVGAITWALLKHDEIEDLTKRAWRSCTGGCIAGVHEATLEPDHTV